MSNNKILNIDNNNLRNNFDNILIAKEQLDKENRQLKIVINKQNLNLQQSLLKIKSFEIRNSEIKKTISGFIINYKNLQEKLNLVQNSKNLETENDLKKVKFYQDENTRLKADNLEAR